MKPFIAAIVGDLQIPYHDENAVDVAQQIIADAGVDIFFVNGDFMDVANMSKFPSMRTPQNAMRVMDYSSEILLSKQIYQDFVRECKPKKIKFNDGNHEYRTLRAFLQTDKTEMKQIGSYLLGLENNPICTKAFLNFGINVSFREYPHGQWLHPTLPQDKNIWVEHGNSVQSKAGYTVQALQARRQGSVLINHVHRLSVAYKHVLGNRDYLMIENGHLSIFGVPVKGDGMYQGPHHTVADYQDAKQGFTMLTYADGEWHPELIQIKNGKALYHGKSYKSRIIVGKQQQLQLR